MNSTQVILDVSLDSFVGRHAGVRGGDSALKPGNAYLHHGQQQAAGRCHGCRRCQRLDHRFAKSQKTANTILVVFFPGEMRERTPLFDSKFERGGRRKEQSQNEDGLFLLLNEVVQSAWRRAGVVCRWSLKPVQARCFSDPKSSSPWRSWNSASRRSLTALQRQARSAQKRRVQRRHPLVASL